MHKIDSFYIYEAVLTFNPAKDLANVFFLSFLCRFSFIPEVYEIKVENSEPVSEFGSQEQHVFVLGSSDGNGSGTTIDLIQKLFGPFSAGELMMKDKEETHSEESTAPANDKQQDKKGNLEFNRLEDPGVSCLFGFFSWWKMSNENSLTGGDDRMEGLIL